MSFTFDKCCCCIDLRTGCLVIGYLNLVGEIILILLSILGLVGAGVLTEQAKDDDAKAVGALAFILMGVLLFFTILFLAFTIVLLVGVHQHKRGHIKAYLIYAAIFMVIYIIAFFAGFANTPINVGFVIRDLISIALSIYFLLCIRSYYLQMDDPSKRPAIYNTA